MTGVYCYTRNQHVWQKNGGVFRRKSPQTRCKIWRWFIDALGLFCDCCSMALEKTDGIINFIESQDISAPNLIASETQNQCFAMAVTKKVLIELL